MGLVFATHVLACFILAACRNIVVFCTTKETAIIPYPIPSMVDSLTGIFTHVKTHKNQPVHVGKYTSHMDPIGWIKTAIF